MVCGVTEERCRGVLRLSFQPRAACIEGRHRGVVRFACILFVKTCFSRSVMDSHCWRKAASVPLRRLVFLGFANGKNHFFRIGWGCCCRQMNVCRDRFARPRKKIFRIVVIFISWYLRVSCKCLHSHNCKLVWL